jgi:esterase
MAKLSTRIVEADGHSPARWLAVIHGIYGAGRNWRSVARKLVEERTDWGAVLVDLRQHGDSLGFRPPHTLERAAADLDTVTVAPVRAVLGHSFGGKVALLRGRGDPGIRQVWVVDSTPEAREPEGSAWDMLEILRRLPRRFEDRETAVAALVSRVDRPVALWMTANLERTDSGFTWRIDLDDMEALLLDFFRTDLWDVVEAPRDGLEIHFVRATRSPVLGMDALARIREAGVATGRVFTHDVLGGHWLNADNPDALVDLIGPRL